MNPDNAPPPGPQDFRFEPPSYPDAPTPAPMAPPPVPVDRGIVARVRKFMKDHGRKIWWLHSVYALGLGFSVVVVANKGFERARWLAASVGAVWVVILLFFRIFGSGANQMNIERAKVKVKMGFYVMTYALKNLYQGMLFFLLPFYYKSTTMDSPNVWFVFLLGICAILSTLDIVFDHYVMRFRYLASIFHGIILFGCLNLVIPALLPDTRTVFSLMAAAAVSVMGVFTLHMSTEALKNKATLLLAVLSVVGSTGVVYVARRAIPPVPMHLSRAAVGPKMLWEGGPLAMEVKVLYASEIQQLKAVTDVVVPGGKGDRLRHIWRRDGQEVQRMSEKETSNTPTGKAGTIRLESQLVGNSLPYNPAGSWSVDVETEDGQIVGRTAFEVLVNPTNPSGSATTPAKSK